MPRWFMTIPMEERNIITYCSGLCSYKEFKHIIRHTILYENLTTDSANEISKLFDMIQIPQEHVQLGLKALEHHSQEGFIGKTARNSEIYQDVKDLMDGYFMRLDLPVRTASTLEEFKALFGLNKD